MQPTIHPLVRPSCRHRAPFRPGTRTFSATLVALSLLVLALLAPPAAVGQAHDHDSAHDGHHDGLHFSHPLVTESVSPDTKLRVDHRFFDFPTGDGEHSGLLEGEYAFHRSVSLEVGLPFSYTDGAAGNLEATLKFANYSFEEAGVLLGYGLQVAAPTNGEAPHEDDHDHEHAVGPRAAEAAGPGGTGQGGPTATTEAPPPPMFHRAAGVRGVLGTPEWQVAPFLTAGIRRGAWEVVSWFIFAVPFAHESDEEVGTELAWDFSALRHLSDRVQALVEVNGSAGLSGSAVGEEVLTVSPGLKYRIFAGRPAFLGLSTGFPLIGEDPFDARLLASLLWHF